MSLLAATTAMLFSGLTSTGDVCVHIDYKKLCKSTGDLVSQSEYNATGSDASGSYSLTGTRYGTRSAPSKPVFTTEVLSYKGAGMTIYRQKFPVQLNGTQDSDKMSDGLASEFPSFEIKDNKEYPAFIQWAGNMVGSAYTIGKTSDISAMVGGIELSGPMALFNTNSTTVVSSGNEFMSHSQAIRNNNFVSFGLMGGVMSIPAGFVMDTIVVDRSNMPVADAVIEWGDILLNRYGKDKQKSLSDFTTEYLGYSTDNGAYYYYNTEEGKNYQQTIIDVKAYTDKENIPIRHWLMDSWWYFKGDKGGVKNWTAMPSIFPDGIDTVYNATELPIIAHNRYWSHQTDYAKQNGGEWDFIVESEASMPTDQAFWDWLLADAKKWGLHVYEQDWLHNEFTYLNASLSSATLGRQWLMQMGTAAERHVLTIQYCMSYCRHILQSVELQAVTQARASGDYQPGNDQWKPMGVTSILAHAVGLKPTKDNFWTTDSQDGSPKYPKLRERFNRLQSAVSTFSTGPVAIADKVGSTDRSLVMMSCNAGGKLLAPDRPAMILNAALMQEVGLSQSTTPKGYLWATHSHLAAAKFSYVIAIETDAGTVSAADLGVTAKSIAWEHNSTSTYQQFDDSHPISMKPADKWSFNVWTVAPVLNSGMVFMGETDKWVSASSSRFSGFTDSTYETSVTIRGVSGEVVTTKWIVDGKIVDVACTIPKSSSVLLSMPLMTCTDQ